MRVSAALRLGATIFLMASLHSSDARAQPGGDGAGGGSPAGPGNQPLQIDPEKDDVLVKIKAAVAPTAEQAAAILSRYKKLREDQRATLRDLMRGRGPGGPGGPGGGRPSPEVRAKLEAKLREKIDPLNSEFLADVRRSLKEEQQAKLDAVAKELDLAPIRGPGPTKPFTLKNRVKIEEKDGVRVITSNGIPDHTPGQFPGRGNPNAISEQSYTFRMTLSPKVNEAATPHRFVLAGVALNGVVIHNDLELPHGTPGCHPDRRRDVKVWRRRHELVRDPAALYAGRNLPRPVQ